MTADWADKVDVEIGESSMEIAPHVSINHSKDIRLGEAGIGYHLSAGVEVINLSSSTGAELTFQATSVSMATFRLSLAAW